MRDLLTEERLEGVGLQAVVKLERRQGGGEVQRFALFMKEFF
jgi:hypothetical protein